MKNASGHWPCSGPTPDAPGERRTDARADQRIFGNRRVEHALVAELLFESGGEAEDAAEVRDVLAI
jgi:hypothetical protein